MKNRVFIFLVLFAVGTGLPAEVEAQRLYRGQQSIGVSAGFVDNASFRKEDNAGYFMRLEFTSIDRHRNAWVVGAQTSVKYYSYLRSLVGVIQYIGDIGYQVPVVYNYRRNYVFSFQVGGNAAYEAVSASDRVFPDGAQVNARDGFIYGAYVGAGARVYLSNRVAFLMDFKERFMTGSDVASFHANFGAGIQIMLKN